MKLWSRSMGCMYERYVLVKCMRWKCRDKYSVHTCCTCQPVHHLSMTETSNPRILNTGPLHHTPLHRPPPQTTTLLLPFDGAEVESHLEIEARRDRRRVQGKKGRSETREGGVGDPRWCSCLGSREVSGSCYLPPPGCETLRPRTGHGGHKFPGIPPFEKAAGQK